jgi:D-alanine-D-alanine ligase
MNILLIVGVESAIQGWGDLSTSLMIQKSLQRQGHTCVIRHFSNNFEVLGHVLSHQYDLVWSSIYCFNSKKDQISDIASEQTVFDLLEKNYIPCVGSSSNVNKLMLDKYQTILCLKQHGISTHEQLLVSNIQELGKISKEKLFYPCFIKPNFESESNGISESNVVHNYEELCLCIKKLFDENFNPVLIEEYLPGCEYTVNVFCNRESISIYPIAHEILSGGYKQYPIITNSAKEKNMIRFYIPESEQSKINALIRRTVHVLGCRDHVRIDLRVAQDHSLKVLEVNGIPGLNPAKSRSLEIHSLYHPTLNKEEVFDKLIGDIIHCSYERLYQRITI